MSRQISSRVLAALTLLLTTGGAGAQTAQPARRPDGTGPQTAVPAPRTGEQADVPGGSSRNGVIRPPATGGAMAVIPPPQQGTMPVIRPPGTNGAQPSLVPK